MRSSYDMREVLAVDRHEARRAAGLLALGAAPFVLARVGDVTAAPLVCPFRAATGLPCPLCGATRAVAYASAGDPSFLQYGAVWAVVLALVALTGAVALVAVLLGRRPLGAIRRAVAARGRWTGWALVAAVAAVAWAWALAHQDTITAGSVW